MVFTQLTFFPDSFSQPVQNGIECPRGIIFSFFGDLLLVEGVLANAIFPFAQQFRLVLTFSFFPPKPKHQTPQNKKKNQKKHRPLDFGLFPPIFNEVVFTHLRFLLSLHFAGLIYKQEPPFFFFFSFFFFLCEFSH